jgi:hypothetical protein
MGNSLSGLSSAFICVAIDPSINMINWQPARFFQMAYVKLRSIARRRPRLLRYFRVILFSMRLGPWRDMRMRWLTFVNRNKPLATNTETIFPDLDVEQSVAGLNQQGLARGLHLPEEYLAAILGFCAEHPAKSYLNPHRYIDAVRTVSYDPKVIAVARKYLGVEPILYGTRIYRSLPQFDAKGATADRPKRAFHYDAGDYKTLIVFIYLSDVDEDCGPHVVIEKTHGRKSFWQLVSPTLTYEAAQDKYRNDIRIILGKKGTGFFEELSAYHQHSLAQKDRLVLTITYLLQRNY